jgi:hypothetical protein
MFREESEDRLVSLGRTLRPGLAVEEQVPLLMMGLYADESEAENPGVFTIAGWMASPSEWDQLRGPWMKLLETAGPKPVSALHMKDLTPDPPKGEFEGWSPKDRDALVIGAVDLLVGAGAPMKDLYAVGTTVVVDDFTDLALRMGVPPIAKNTHYLMLYRDFLFQAMFFPVAARGIDCVFDTRKGIEGKALKYFAMAKTAINSRLPRRVGAIAFMDDTDEPALQAADLLAYELRRRVWQRIREPDRPVRRSYERIKAGTAKRSFRCYDRAFWARFRDLAEQYKELEDAPLDEQWVWVNKTVISMQAPED